MTKTISMVILLLYDALLLYMAKLSNFKNEKINFIIYLIPIAMCIIGALG